ncbi:hypothetical protein B7494_g1549 [Chlorociboria aeruginascens]|nr:hypothetical protein B7494_g1549 [Chlorociboria aeruginascens]
MEQTKALNSLAPFLALTKSASSPRAAADLITRATSHPNTFIFSELLQAPQIQSLSSSTEYSPHLALLKIFSYGTYHDYRSTPNLPPINDTQVQKLRQLSLLALAKDPSSLSYQKLLSALGLETPRELEDLVISAFYAGLLSGTLDPYNQQVRISSISALRDLPPRSVSAMLATLNEWSGRCVGTLSDLERQIATVKADALRRHKEERDWAIDKEKLIETGGAKGSRKLGQGAASKRGVGMIGEDEDADMDDEDGEDIDEEKKDIRSARKRGFSAT